MDYEQLVKALREAPDDWYDADLHRDAADAIEALEKQIDSIENDKTNLETDIINLEIALDKVNAQLPKRGEWVYNDGDYIPYCSICGMPQDIETPYCHSCGAKMMEAPKEE